MQVLPDIFLLDGFAYAQHPNFYLLVDDVVTINNANFEPELGWQGGEDFDRPAYLQSLRRLAVQPMSRRWSAGARAER